MSASAASIASPPASAPHLLQPLQLQLHLVDDHVEREAAEQQRQQALHARGRRRAESDWMRRATPSCAAEARAQPLSPGTHLLLARVGEALQLGDVRVGEHAAGQVAPRPPQRARVRMRGQGPHCAGRPAASDRVSVQVGGVRARSGRDAVPTSPSVSHATAASRCVGESRCEDKCRASSSFTVANCATLRRGRGSARHPAIGERARD